ncbi:MAG TPA: DUF5723 family protein [Flavobacteriales bacterium]|jgi:hypothetical protein|nr:hypothetical protein [Flavobacteriales bacterium]MBK8530395.1 hypothetical protein [Flavobacteriales bacterium]MBP8878436.1 hypothetical protein [Flavobacteriales bacterium]HQW07234.1 DUF5723 family protein [Flavobacteriales bacterium]HQX00297.1 DUF5723 family protein [Flavobacteriales bacterium]
MVASRSFLFVLAASAALFGASQPFVLPQEPGVDLNAGWDHTLTVSGIFDYNANTIRNELPMAIYRGGYLERELRQRSLDALSSKHNAAGYALGGRLTWTGPACWERLPGWRPRIDIAHHEQGGLRFTADQYELTFFGNAPFENEQAILSPSAFTQVRYQTVGFGTQHTRSGSFLRLDVVRGQSYQAVDVRWASLFTGEDGRVLRSALLGDYYASDTAGSGLDRTNGVGMAIAGRWNTDLRVGKRSVAFSAWLEDFGFVGWNGNSVRIHKDTLIRFTGFDVENVFELDHVLLGEDELLDTFGSRYRTGAFTKLLPFQVGIQAVLPLGERWKVGLAVDHRHLPGYVPQAMLLASRRVGMRTQLGTTLSYGGFGGIRWGFGVKHRFGQHVLLSASTPQIPAFVLGSVGGLGLWLGVSVAF